MKYVGWLIVTIFLIDFIKATSVYYSGKLDLYLESKVKEKRLEYLREVVILGYKTLASESKIKEALLNYRELEAELSKEEYDFSKEEEIYKTQLNEAVQRGYF